jgi:hypothetical protein
MLSVLKFFSIIFIASIFFTTVHGQSFFRDYQKSLKGNGQGPFKPNEVAIKNMEKSFNLFKNQTNINLLDKGKLFIVRYYDIQTGQSTFVVWNGPLSFYYRFRFNEPIEFHQDASAWLKSYKPEFRKWVESSDTTSYGAYGRQTSWFDAPSVTFTVATKLKARWHFITSGTYYNNVDKLD